MTKVVKTLLVLAAVGAAMLTTGAGPAAAAQPCWKKLINDWYDGRIDGTYPVKCYKDAEKNAPVDVKAYSSLKDDLDRALAFAIHNHNRKVPPGFGRNGLTPPTAQKGAKGTSGKAGKNSTTTAPTGGQVPTTESPIERFAGQIGPKKSDSLPLPLIILGALALLLLAAGAAGALARRLQGRRVPAPPAPPNR